MKLWGYLRMIVVCLTVVIIVFTVTSLLDILIALFYPRFYSDLAFIVSFGIGGIFGSVFSYFAAINLAPESRVTGRWLLITLLIISGLVLFFVISKIESGEYEAAFKAYGATLAMGSLLFINENVETM